MEGVAAMPLVYRTGPHGGESGYNSHVKAVNIAELKDSLSAYLQKVRAGEEFLIRDRNLPVAKLVPLDAAEADAEELALAAAGKLSLPGKSFDAGAFWSIGAEWEKRPKRSAAVRRAVSRDREERDAGLLGR